MKKSTFILFGAACFGLFHPNASAQSSYQLRNSGFEEPWIEYEGSKTGTVLQPSGWHSFPSASGGFFANMANAKDEPRVIPSSDTRPESKGEKSLIIYPRSILGIALANGNLTTGRINAGSASPGDATKNFNYTDTEEGSDFCNPFAGHPDSVSVWVKYTPAKDDSNARLNIVLHDKGYYQDPVADPATKEIVVAQASLDYPTTEKKWKRLSIPFTYTEQFAAGKVKSAYALASFSTNSVAGGGAATDSVYIDDIEMIYNSELLSFSINGKETEVTANEILVDQSYDAQMQMDFKTNGIGASVTTSYNAGNYSMNVRVEGNNISEDAENYHTYTIRFKNPNGVDEIYSEQVSDLKIVSNPGMNGIEITAQENQTIQIYVLGGALYRSEEIKAGVTTINLPCGFYIINNQKIIVL